MNELSIPKSILNSIDKINRKIFWDNDENFKKLHIYYKLG